MVRVTPRRRSTLPATGFGPSEGSPAPGRLESFARLIRLFPMGITVLYPIVGLATSTGQASAGDWLRLIVVGVLFHVYAHVANDVIDLPIDRFDPRRGRDPMILGRVLPQWGLWIALSMLPVMALFLLGQPISVAAFLAAAVALLGIYDVASKTISVPFLADFVQGAGWAALVFVGAGVGGGPSGATGWAAGFVVAFIALVNGVHGAVRDVENDRRSAAKTTAVMLGVRIRESGMVLPATIVAYAAVLQLALGATVAGVLVGTRDQGDVGAWRAASALTTIVFLLSAGQLVSAFRQRSNLRSAIAAGTWHMVLAPLALSTAALWTLDLPLAAFSAVVFVAPPLLYGRVLGAVTPQLPATTIHRSVSTSRIERHDAPVCGR